MVLTNYWWLLIWLFTGGIMFAVLFPKRQEVVCGKIEYRWSWPAAIGLAVPYLIWAVTRSDAFGDTGTYFRTFRDMPASIGKIIPYLEEHTKDQGFSVFSIAIKSFFGDSRIWYFLIIALIQIILIVAVFRKYSSDYWISMLLFIMTTDYLSWMHNGIRQFLAVTMIFGCFGFIVQQRYIPAICAILLASTIHGSALIMLPIIFIVQGKALNKKTVLVVLGMLVTIVMIDKFTPFLNDLLAETQYNDMIGNEIWAVDDGTSILRVLVYSVPAIMAIVGKRYIRYANDPVINVCVNCSLITMGIYGIASVSSGIYIGRLPIYTTLMGYISLPWLIDNMFSKTSAKIVKIIMILAFLVFFYYQMHFTWKLI